MTDFKSRQSSLHIKIEFTGVSASTSYLCAVCSYATTNKQGIFKHQAAEHSQEDTEAKDKNVSKEDEKKDDNVRNSKGYHYMCQPCDESEGLNQDEGSNNVKKCWGNSIALKHHIKVTLLKSS